MTGIVHMTIATDLPVPVFTAWAMQCFPNLPPEHVDQMRHDGFCCYADEMPAILERVVNAWDNGDRRAYTLSFNMRPIFDLDAEEAKQGDVKRLFIASRTRRNEGGREHVRGLIEDLLKSLGASARVVQLDKDDSGAEVHDLLESIFGEGRHAHKPKH